MSEQVKDRVRPTGRWHAPAWVAGLFLLLAVVLAYQPVCRAGFIWDDDDYVTNNPLLVAPDGLWRIWFSTDAPSQYFPLTYTVFRLEHALWGFHAAGYHWVNLLLHAANSIVVWRLLLRLRVPGAWLAAAIFALHPVQVESVAWISECKNVLMCLFFLLSLLGWIEFTEQPAGRRWVFYFLSLTSFALALSAKTTACTLPAALVLVLWLRGKEITRWRWLQIAPYFALALGMGALTMWWERNHIGTQGRLFSLGWLERVLIASHALWFYAGKLFWPVNLTFSYPKWTIQPDDPWAYGWLVLLGVGFGVVYFVRRFVGRGVETALLFYAATLSPLLGLVMLYTFRYTYVADHYQYVASIGLIALVSAGGFKVFKNRPFAGLAAGGILLLILGVATWRQAGTYTNAETLWRTTIARNPGSWMAYGNLGAALFRDGQVDEAIACYDRALAINPDYGEARNNLGVAWLKKGRVDEAIQQYQRALVIAPDDWEGAYNLGNAFFQKGNLNAAIASFQRALVLEPASVAVNIHLGNTFFEEGRMEQAIPCYQAALKYAPDDVEADNNLGSAYLRQKKWDEAIACYQRTLKMNPDLAAVRNNLGDALFQAGRWDEAAAQYRRVLTAQPDFAPARSGLDRVLQGQRK